MAFLLVTYGVLLTLFISACPTHGADICPVGTEMELCTYGCCTNACCNMSTIAIVGMVIGILIMLATIIGCIVCLVCMCKSRGGRQDVLPMNNTNSTYVNNSGYGQHPPPRNYDNRYGGYNSHRGGGSSNPGAYGSYSDPAYPPGAVQSDFHPPPAYNYNDPYGKTKSAK